MNLRLFSQAMVLCLACLLLTARVRAQDTTTTKGLLEYIFQHIDKSQVSTGFLEEYGCPMLPMLTFNGTLTDSNRVDMNLWRTLYFQMQTSFCGSGSNPLPAITTANSNIGQHIKDTIGIPLLVGTYNTVRSDAFSSSLFSYSSGTNQIYDVPGRPQSPYDTRNLFASCPSKKVSLWGNEVFLASSNMIWNSTGKTISQLEIDFDNGDGFTTVTIGTAIPISYDDTGHKRWTIKLTMTDASVYQCYSDYYVLASSGLASRYSENNGTIPVWGFISPTASHSGATVHIQYSDKSRTNTLRKPLIVVEGYDVSSVAPNLQPDYRMRDFVRDINAPTSSYDFNSALDDVAGYDLVFINFNNGTDDIVRNAAIVQEVINLVNANKVNDGRFGSIRQQNVVMGVSMGGLCARYALANMTKNFPLTPTETKLLITHDSPHRGANIALGLQYLIRMMGGFELFGTDVYDIYPDYDDALSLLDATATQQLLLYRSTSATTYAANTFLDGTYRPMITFSPSDPQPSYKFVATSNGNECAQALFNPGKTFINIGAGASAGISAKLLFFKIPIVSYKLAAEVEAYALPNTGSTAKIARLYTVNNLKLFGFINVFKQLYNATAYAPGTHLPVDGVPGSNYPILDVEALNEIGGLPYFSANFYVTFPLGPILSGYVGIYAYNLGFSPNFTFISVGSALDVSPYVPSVFSQKYVNGVNGNYPSSSDMFIAQETVTGEPYISNNAHMTFTARNARFLYKEMENQLNLEQCSAECTNPYVIAGNWQMCGDGTYKLMGLPTGATVTWSVSPAFGIVNITSTSGNQINLQRVGSGVVTLSASLVNVCGGNQTISTPIQVGLETPGLQSDVSNGDFVCEDDILEFMVDPFDGSYTYEWSISSGTIQTGQGNWKMRMYSDGSPTLTVWVRSYSVECGYSAYTSRTYNFETCWRRVELSPNPATKSVTISVDNKQAPGPVVNSTNARSTTVKAKPESSSGIKLIRFYSVSGIVVKTKSFNSLTENVQIDVQDLPPGVYIVEITDASNRRTRKKLMITK